MPALRAAGTSAALGSGVAPGLGTVRQASGASDAPAAALMLKKRRRVGKSEG